MSEEFIATKLFPIAMKYFTQNDWKRCTKALKKECQLKISIAKTLFNKETPDLAEIIQFWFDHHKESETNKSDEVEQVENEQVPEPTNGETFFEDRNGSKKRKETEKSDESSNNKKQKKEETEKKEKANGKSSKKDKKKKQEKQVEEPVVEGQPVAAQEQLDEKQETNENEETPKKEKKSKKDKKAKKTKNEEVEKQNETDLQEQEDAPEIQEENTSMEVSTPKSDANKQSSPPNTPPSEKKRKANEPFRRVKEEEIQVDPRLASNDFTAKNGDEWGKKAWQDLKVVKGKDFRHAKTKKKKGTYRGGQLDMGVNSVKFGNSDDE